MARQTKEDRIKELEKQLENTQKWLRQAEERNQKLVNDAETEFLNSPTYNQLKDQLSFYKDLSELNSINIANYKKMLQQSRENARKVFEDNKRLLEGTGNEYSVGMTEGAHDQADYQKLLDSIHDLQGKLCAKELYLKLCKKEMERLRALAANVQKENEQILNTDNINNEIVVQLEKYKVENENLKKELEFNQNKLQVYESMTNAYDVGVNDKYIERFIEQNQQKMTKGKKGAPVKIKEETINNIINMRQNGCSIRAIAKATNVSVGMVHLIIKRNQQQ